MLEAEKYDRTTLVSVDLIDDGSRSRVHLMSSDIKDMHGSSTASPVEVSTRSIPVGSLPAGTSLEPILQGQELFVSSAATCSPVHINPFFNANHFQEGSKFTVQSCNSPSHQAIQLKMEACCPCRLISSELQSFQHKNYHHEVVQASCKTPVTETPVKTTNLQNHSPSVRGQPDNHTNNKDSITSRSNWARGIFERLRAASLTSSTIESKASHCPYATISYNDSAFRYKDYHHHHQQHDIMNVTPDIIDPRRLPKAHGPVSNCLEFSKRPLQKSNYHTNYISKPIPLSSTHTDLISTSLSSSLQSSTNVNKRRRRVRWFSHSTSCDPEPRDPLFSPSNCHSHLNSSAAEEIQGAVHILAGRQVFPSSGVNCSRPGIRVKSASESEHLLVISKSLSNSKEDFSPHAFGHFDENRVYTTLFRHSTCYDVLPDSGKLVILDSRLPTLRAMSALLDNGVMAAPVWSNETQSYLGVFSQDLALDMLAHLHYSEVNSNGNMDCPSTVFSSSSSSSPPSSFSPFKTNFFRWGSKQLGEILNLMYGLSNHQLSSYLLVHPQYCLQKALYQLFHHLEHHNSNQQQQHHHHHCNDTLLNFKLSNASGHRASYPNNSPKMLIEKETTTGVNFTRQSSTLFPTHSNHSSSEVSVSHENDVSFVRLSPVHNPTPQSTSTDHPMSNGKNNHNSSLNSSSSSSPLLHFQRVSSKCCPHSNPSSLYTSLVSHLLVVDHHSGNALGLLGADRLLAYLRLRVDELPCTGRMNVPIGSVYGLRWSERYSSIKTPNDSKPCTRLIPSPPPATTTPTVTTIKVNGYSLSQKEIPVIHPNDCVRDVLHVLAIWLPQLPCLPVIQFMENNQMRPIDFIGLISSSDILNFIICSTPDTALDEPISKIMQKKSLHCASQQNCICFATESLTVVLDRMFRLKTPSLIMFDTRKSSASCAVATKPFGQPVGMVTAKDLLHSVILGHCHRHHHLHPQHYRHSSQSNRNGSQNLMSNDADEHEAKTTDSYKRTISYESGIHSSSCQDGSEFMRASDVPTFERIHSENTKEKKPSQSPTSTCSLSSNGTFSASSSDSEVSQSMSRDHFKSKCNDNAAPSIECNCSCHRRDSGNNNAASLHVSSTSVSSRQRQRRDYQDSIVGSTNVGHVDKMNSRLASPYNLVPNSEWDAGRRSSESYTKQQKTKEKMHALNDGQRRLNAAFVLNKTKQPVHNNDSNNSLLLLLSNNSLNTVDELNIGEDVSSSQLDNHTKHRDKYIKGKIPNREEDDTVFPMD